MADVASAAKDDAKPRSRVCRSERRALAASEQRRRDADAANLSQVAKTPPARALSPRLSPSPAEPPSESPPRSRSEVRLVSDGLLARARGRPRVRGRQLSLPLAKRTTVVEWPRPKKNIVSRDFLGALYRGRGAHVCKPLYRPDICGYAVTGVAGWCPPQNQTRVIHSAFAGLSPAQPPWVHWRAIAAARALHAGGVPGEVPAMVAPFGNSR